jgi:hypothetical protein
MESSSFIPVPFKVTTLLSVNAKRAYNKLLSSSKTDCKIIDLTSQIMTYDPIKVDGVSSHPVFSKK